MTLNPASRLTLVVLCITVFLILLSLPIARLAHFGSLGGLPVGMAGLLAVLIRDLPGIRKLSEISRKLLLAGTAASGLVYILATWMDSTSL